MSGPLAHAGSVGCIRIAVLALLVAGHGDSAADRDVGLALGDEDDEDDEEDDDDDDPDDDDEPADDPEPPRDIDAVGALVDDGQRVFCTGALLSADTVLTAAHCVAQDGVVRWPWGLLLGQDVTLGGQFVRVLDGAVHPAYDPFLHAADLAVLRIAGGSPRGTFLDLGGAVPAVGTAVRIFGFGSGAAGPSRRDAEVTAQSAEEFRYQPGTCPGDSGGPVLFGDGLSLAGVVSTGAAGCGSARAVAAAPHAEWIREAMNHLDPPACRAGDGVCGQDCRLGDLDCACVDDDGACHLCAGTDRDCSGSCETDGACVTACLAPDPDCRTLQEGAACERDVECASSACAGGVCREPCLAATGDGCPPWAGCVPAGSDESGGGVCIPYEDEPVVGGCGAAPSSGGAGALALTLLAVASRRRSDGHRSRTNTQGERR